MVRRMPTVEGRHLIWVDGEAVARCLKNGTYEPVVVVRDRHSLGGPAGKPPVPVDVPCRDVYWRGPSRFVFREVALPNRPKVHGWIETDGGVCMVMTDGTVYGPEEFMALRNRGRLIVHLDVPVLRKNAEDGGDRPVLAVRSAATFDDPDDVQHYRELLWDGPSRLCHRPACPVPGTNGRGQAFVEVDGPVTGIGDDGIDTVTA